MRSALVRIITTSPAPITTNSDGTASAETRAGERSSSSAATTSTTPLIRQIVQNSGRWPGRRMSPTLPSPGVPDVLGATALLFGSGIVGAFVDNIPTTATVSVIEDMVAGTGVSDRRAAGPG